MIDANYEFTADDRQYRVVWECSQVNGPAWWLVTRDDGEHVTVPFVDAAGSEIERPDVERMALQKFRDLKPE